MSRTVEKAALNELLRSLPQVEQVLAELGPELALWRRDAVKRIVQSEIAALRAQLEQNGAAEGNASAATDIAGRVRTRLAELSASVLKPVVNATGIVLHTNLGRAVLSAAAQQAIAAVAAGYSNLEVDLASGKRTRRDITLEPLLTALTGAPSATVVNNCAAAVYLTLHTLAAGREVITSRGELVEIGGSYRVPDVVAASGCQLIEVGTTNRTRAADYERALTADTALLLKTHPSNYRIRGFTEEASVEELVALGRRSGVPVVVDLGSGWMPTARVGQDSVPVRDSRSADAQSGQAETPVPPADLNEPSVHEMLAAGADLVLFSGDKLLGGPQAGIAVGSTAYIKRLRDSALWRVLRIDKLTGAALGATLLEHLQGVPGSPTYAGNVRADSETATKLAEALRAARPDWSIEVIDAPGSWGGGSLPDEQIPSRAVTIVAPDASADELDRRLRTGTPAIAGYILRGRYALNVLTLLPGDAERIVRAVSANAS